jgi:uncharacterized protein (DUF433 family)
MSMSATRPVSGTRILRDPQILGGEPIVRGTRISVRTIVVAHRGWGDTDRILREYPQLQPIDVEEALAYYEEHRPEIDRFIHGFRPPGFTEDEVRLAVGWTPP